jgi:hypothetical protein
MSSSPSPLPLSTYPTKRLIQLWRREELTAEPMIGQRSAELTPKPAPTHRGPGSARAVFLIK